MSDAQKAPTTVAQRKGTVNKRSVPSRFQNKGLLRSVIGVRPHIDKWVLAELNNICEQLKNEFIIWYYYLINLPEDPEIATDGFRNFSLNYKHKPLVDKFVNSAPRQHISIATLPK